MPTETVSLPILCLTMNPSVDLATDTEQVVPTHKLRCGPTLHDAGGGGVNVVRVLTRLGGRCLSLCPKGGPTGQWLEDRMRAEGLETRFLKIGEETRVSFTVHETRSGSEFRFVMPGPMLTGTEWQAMLSMVDRLDPFPALVVASGSLPPGVPVDFYGQLALRLRARGSRLVLDTSGAPLKAALEAGVYMVKPNLRELSELCGRPLEDAPAWNAAARELVQKGQAEVVALTLGHLGATLMTADEAWTTPALPVTVSSAVGAGDSFVGGMVWALQQGKDAREAFTWGVASGTAALVSVGTGLCQPADVQRLQPLVKLGIPH
ncbi:MAG: 1-phosphofructokinase family hexose kinase [Gammaproteobacteria bacterium]